MINVNDIDVIGTTLNRLLFIAVLPYIYCEEFLGQLLILPSIIDFKIFSCNFGMSTVVLVVTALLYTIHNIYLLNIWVGVVNEHYLE